MHFHTVVGAFLLSHLATTGFAQSLTEVLEGNNELSGFHTLIKRHPAVLDVFQNRVKNKTLFVPNNRALLAFGQLNNLTISEQQATLRYHILNGTYDADALSAKGGVTLETYLENDQYALLGGGGNVIFSSRNGDSGLGGDSAMTEVFTGLGAKSGVLRPNIQFNGGIIHVVDSVFSLPRTCTETASKAGLTSLLNALVKTELTTYVDTTKRITCFAPSDEAFAKAGSPEKTLSKEDLTLALQYHTLQGDFVGYSDLWKNGQKFVTLSGETVTVRRDDSASGGGLFLNNVRVLKANVITSNGVAHVLDGVLTPPKNGTDSPSGTTTGAPNATETAKSSAEGMGKEVTRGLTNSRLAALLAIGMGVFFM